MREAELLRADVSSLWDRGYLLAAPTCAFPPPLHGTSGRNPLLFTFTAPGNVVDATALAIPFGTFAGTSLPRSVQILGPPGSERALISVASRLIAP